MLEPTVTTRRSGRPATLSRDLILDTGSQLARSAPDTPVSISAIARALGVTPMALYTYVGSKDELLQALSAHLLEGLVVVSAPDATPVDRIVAWAYAVRDHCLEHPQLLTMLTWEGGHNSTAWLNRSLPLFEAVEALGFEGEEQGLVMLWLWHSVVNAVQFELHLRQAGSSADETDGVLDPRVSEGVRLVQAAAGSAAAAKRYFAFQLDRIVDAIAAMRQSGGRSPA